MSEEPGGPLGDFLRLTSIQRQEARPPESGELNLAEYEGKAIMVTGYVDSDWVCSAAVIDEAGLILTAVTDLLIAGIQHQMGNLSKWLAVPLRGNLFGGPFELRHVDIDKRIAVRMTKLVNDNKGLTVPNRGLPNPPKLQQQTPSTQ